MAIQDTYRDPLFIKWYIDPLTGQKIVTSRTNEPHKIVNNIIMLAEIPSEDDKVNIINIGEITLYEAPLGTILDENHFSVNYTLGLINLSDDYDGQTAIVPEYYSRGIIFYPSSRIYYELNESGTDIQSTLKDFTDSIIAYSYKGIYDDETSYEQNNQVYFQGSTYICIVPLSVGNVPTNSNYWRILGAGFDEKGEYSNSISYYARDIILYDNELYVAKITPPVGTTPTNTTYWDKLVSFKTIIENAEIATQNAQDAADNANIVADSLIYLGDYNNSYPYKVRNFVRYQNSLYICKSDSTGHIPTNTTYWDNVSKAFTWKDAYNSSTSYTIFDVVSYLGSSYICILDSTNNIPTNTTYWSPMALKGEKGATLSPRGAYSNIETYSQNDLVSYEGSTWTCKQTSTGNIPEIGSTYWDIFVLGGGTVTEVTSANTDISVSTGTTTPVLTLNSSTTKTANKIVKRDSSGNIVDVGDTSALATTDKSSVVAAINETVDEIDILSTNLISTNSNLSSHTTNKFLHAPYGITTNSGNVYSITLGLTSLDDGQTIKIKCNADSTGNVTLNSDDLGSKNVVKSSGTSVTNWKANGIYTVVYNATTGNFIQQGEGGDYGNATPNKVLKGYTIGTENGLEIGTYDIPEEAWFKPHAQWYTCASHDYTVYSEDKGSCVCDGKLYLIYKFGSSTLIDKTLMYNPTTNTWVAETPPNFPIIYHVYVCGVFNHKIYVHTDTPIDSTHDRIYIYDTILKTWSNIIVKTTSTHYTGGRWVMTDENTFYCIGGATGQITDLYDRITDTVTQKAVSPIQITKAGVLYHISNNTIYVFGNDNGTVGTGTLYAYNCSTNLWDTKTSYTTELRYYTTIISKDENTLIMGGGYKDTGTFFTDIKYYDIPTNSYTTHPSAPTAKRVGSLEIINNKLYWFGGYTQNAGNNTFAYFY